MFKSYRKKPVIIKAEQQRKEVKIETLEGMMLCRVGDYLIIGTHGERYPVKKEIFEENYVEVEE